MYKKDDEYVIAEIPAGQVLPALSLSARGHAAVYLVL
jgi:hypothetical protein